MGKTRLRKSIKRAKGEMSLTHNIISANEIDIMFIPDKKEVHATSQCGQYSVVASYHTVCRSLALTAAVCGVAELLRERKCLKS